jgi:hypothetical protein
LRHQSKFFGVYFGIQIYRDKAKSKLTTLPRFDQFCVQINCHLKSPSVIRHLLDHGLADRLPNFVEHRSMDQGCRHTIPQILENITSRLEPVARRPESHSFLKTGWLSSSRSHPCKGTNLSFKGIFIAALYLSFAIISVVESISVTTSSVAGLGWKPHHFDFSCHIRMVLLCDPVVPGPLAPMFGFRCQCHIGTAILCHIEAFAGRIYLRPVSRPFLPYRTDHSKGQGGNSFSRYS